METEIERIFGLIVLRYRANNVVHAVVIDPKKYSHMKDSDIIEHLKKTKTLKFLTNITDKDI